MSRIAYVNGQYRPHRRAQVHIEDRGYQFADGVYEVIAVRAGRLVDEALHLDRLGRSLDALRIAWPVAPGALRQIIAETVRCNRVRNGIVYVQATRGAARRDHPFPKDAKPALVVTARSATVPDPKLVEKGVGVVTLRDERWARCDIKSISLLANVLGKQQARERGAFEAWLIDGDGLVTEGTSSNAWIVTADDRLRTRHLDAGILAGITRTVLLEVARELGLTVEQRAFTPDEAAAAKEAFTTSTTSFVMPVVSIDGRTIGSGAPGPVSRALFRRYATLADAPLNAGRHLPAAPA